MFPPFSKNRRPLLPLLAAAWIFHPVAGVCHGDVHERILVAEKEVGRSPGNREMRWLLAELYYEHGELDSSLRQLDKADRLQPGAERTLLLRAKVLRASGKNATAEALLNRFIEAHPRNSAALLERARIRKHLGNVTGARGDYALLLEVAEAAEPDWYLEAAELQATPGETLKLVEAGLARLGNAPALINKALEAEVAMGGISSALARLESLEKNSKAPGYWMARRASLLARTGRVAESRILWRSLLTRLQSSPRNSASHALQQAASEAIASLQNESAGVSP